MKIHGYRPCRCLQCDMSFAYNSDLIAHMMSHTGEAYQCKQCGIAFSENSFLIRHLSSTNHKIKARSPSPKPFALHCIIITYPCTQCINIFPDKNSLSQHMRTHTAEKLCGKCGVVFECSIELELHMKCHTTKKIYKCRKSDEEFAFNSKLELHLKNNVYQGDDINTGEAILPYQCKQCDKPFKRKTSIMDHMMAHAGEKPYQCSHCDKVFSYNGAACIEHMKIHGERPYQCLQCDMAFSYNSERLAHVRSHTGEAYQCKQCGIAFSDNSYILRHMSIHNAKRQYQCSKCDVFFSHESNLISHTRIHSGDNSYNSDTNTASESKVEVKEELMDYDNFCDLKIEVKDGMIVSYNSDTDTASETEFEIKGQINDEIRNQYDLYEPEFQGKDCHFASIQNDTDKLLEPKIEIKEEEISS